MQPKWPNLCTPKQNYSLKVGPKAIFSQALPRKTQAASFLSLWTCRSPIGPIFPKPSKLQNKFQSIHQSLRKFPKNKTKRLRESPLSFHFQSNGQRSQSAYSTIIGRPHFPFSYINPRHPFNASQLFSLLAFALSKKKGRISLHG